MFDHRRGQVGLDDVVDLRLGEAGCDLASVTAQDQRRPEAAAHVGQALDDALGHLVDEKIEVGVTTRRPVAALPEKPAVEDLRRRFRN